VDLREVFAHEALGVDARLRDQLLRQAGRRLTGLRRERHLAEQEVRLGDVGAGFSPIQLNVPAPVCFGNAIGPTRPASERAPSCRTFMRARSRSMNSPCSVNLISGPFVAFVESRPARVCSSRRQIAQVRRDEVATLTLVRVGQVLLDVLRDLRARSRRPRRARRSGVPRSPR
jgi:hypothetical protein